MAICLQVILILLMALDVHVAGIPVAVFDCGLRSPMRPDAELRIAIPVRDQPSAKRLACPLEGARRDSQIGIGRCLLDCRTLFVESPNVVENGACCSGFAGKKERRRSRNKRERPSSGNPHCLASKAFLRLMEMEVSALGVE